MITIEGIKKMNQTLFVLGAAGYIGKTVIGQAVESGWKVKALVRTAESVALVSGMGAQAVMGDAMKVDAWIDEARGSQAMVDLIQPKLPRRISRRSIQQVAAYRLRVTRELLTHLKRLPESERPLLFNVSGVDDLAPDKDGKISHRSALVDEYAGFAYIGVPVRKLVESSGVKAVYIYLGTVYGPGKAFADTVIPGLIKHRMPVIGSGSNRMAIVHVADAARAVVHLAKQQREIPAGSSWVVTDGSANTQAEFLDGIAALLQAKKPRRVPRWLASLIAGVVTAEVLTRDCRSDISALRQQGFELRYPDWRTGVPQMLKSLAYSI